MNTSKLCIKILFLSFVAITGFCLLSCTFWLWSSAYADFVQTILILSGKQGWEIYFGKNLLSPLAYQKLRLLLAFMLVLWSLSVPLLLKKTESIIQSIDNFGRFVYVSIKQQCQFFCPKEAWFCAVLLFLFTLKACYFIYSYELQYDEAWTYNHFVSKGFLMCLVSPNNNHVLYTLLACISDFLPIEGKYSLRLPVLLGGLSTGLLFYVFIRSFFNWRVAFVALVFFLLSPAITQYSLYARGYIFHVFCTIVLIWTSTKIILKDGYTHHFWVLWVLSSIFGIYAVPSHLIPVLLLSSLVLMQGLSQKPQILRYYWRAHLSLVIILIVLFLPFLITGGFQTLFDAASKTGGDSFWSYQDKVSDWLLWGGGRGTPAFVVWCCFLILIVLLYYRLKDSKELRVLLSIAFGLMLLPLILDGLMGIQPLFRIWCFLTVAVAILLAGFLHYLSRFLKNQNLLLYLALPIAAVLLLRMEVHYAMHWSKQIDKKAHFLAQLMLKNELDSCYSFSNYDKPLLEYYYLRAGKKLHLQMPYKDSQHYAPFEGGKIYTSVLWDKEDGQATAAQISWLNGHYPQIIYEDERIELRLPRH